MKIKTIDELNLKDKRVILRADLNSEIINGKVELNPRIIEAGKSIINLKKRKAKIVIIAHQSRKGKKDFISLKEHCKKLNKITKVKFVEDIIGNKAISEIENLKSGEALLLENIRFLDDEFKPKNNRIVKTLGKYFDYYINDAFSVSHREQTSIVSFPEKIKSAVGEICEKEIKNLENIDTKNSLFILGGSKPKDIMQLIKKEKIIATGTFSILCLIAKGYKLGIENGISKEDLKLLPLIKKELSHIILPVDLAIDYKGIRKDVELNEFPLKYKVLDIGKKSADLFSEIILKEKNSIFMKGTAGLSEKKDFEYGTKEILKAIENSKVFSSLCGGSTSSAVNRFDINKKRIGYISLSGGASVDFISGKKLPGLEAIKRGIK